AAADVPEVLVNADCLTAVLPLLRGVAQYEFCVLAESAAGLSEPSPVLVLNTEPRRPGAPAAPSLASYTIAGDSVLWLTWDMPDDDDGGSPILEFEVFVLEMSGVARGVSIDGSTSCSSINYRPSFSAQQLCQSFLVQGPECVAEVKGLEAFRGHRFSVEARNAEGWSPRSRWSKTIKTAARRFLGGALEPQSSFTGVSLASTSAFASTAAMSAAAACPSSPSLVHAHGSVASSPPTLDLSRREQSPSPTLSPTSPTTATTTTRRSYSPVRLSAEALRRSCSPSPAEAAWAQRAGSHSSGLLRCRSGLTSGGPSSGPSGLRGGGSPPGQQQQRQQQQQQQVLPRAHRPCGSPPAPGVAPLQRPLPQELQLNFRRRELE
ncbi:unnamed protein product, partial [Polarella glacialis]